MFGLNYLPFGLRPAAHNIIRKLFMTNDRV